jgi:hypothetical protein
VVALGASLTYKQRRKSIVRPLTFGYVCYLGVHEVGEHAHIGLGAIAAKLELSGLERDRRFMMTHC